MKEPQWWKERQDCYDFVLEAEKAGAAEWLLKDFILAEGLTIISGAPKLGFKTFIAFAMAMALNRGKPFMGFEPRDGKKRVMFVEAEGGRTTTARRFRSFSNASGVPIDELLQNIIWVHRPLDFMLNTERTFKQVYSLIEQEGIDVIFIDTLNMLSGCDENDATQMGAVMQNIKKWTKRGVSVVLLHHSSKAAGLDWKYPADLALRGSSSIPGAYDVHLHVRNPNPHAPPEFVWEVQSKEAERKYFKGLWYLENTLDASGDRLLQKTTLDFEEIPSLEAASERDLSLLVAELTPQKKYGVEELRGLWGLTRKQARRFIDKLVEEGTFETAGRKYYLP